MNFQETSVPATKVMVRKCRLLSPETALKLVGERKKDSPGKTGEMKCGDD